MLAVLVLWATTPLSACLLTSSPKAMPACCRGMAHESGSTGMSADLSCCQIHQTNALVNPVSPCSLEHSRMLAVALHPVFDARLMFSGFAHRSVDWMPPKAPPNFTSILRI